MALARALARQPALLLLVLSVRGLSAWIGKPGRQAIIRDVDLDLRAGSALATVGPSGSGKTTAARAIVGLHHPATGRLELVSWRRR